MLGLLSVRADLTYQQGMNRMWSRRTRYDYAMPVLAHLGEQAVLRQEIYANGTDANDLVVFGYQERFGEYRYGQSLITGKFRSTYATPLDMWHLSQGVRDGAYSWSDVYRRKSSGGPHYCGSVGASVPPRQLYRVQMHSRCRCTVSLV